MKTSIPSSLIPTSNQIDHTQQLHVGGNRLTRRIKIGNKSFESSISLHPENQENARHDALGEWWSTYLKGSVKPDSEPAGQLSVVDLFCGAGGLALGVKQLSHEMGYSVINELIADSDSDAVSTLAANHSVRLRRTDSITSLIDFRVRGKGETATFTYSPELLDDDVADAASRADLLTAGPPCQGHSNLNNRSRRSDMRNYLLLTVPAFAVAAKINRVVIENVPAVIHADANVIATTRSLLESEGYYVTDGVLACEQMGWPQARKRYFMIACRYTQPIPLDTITACLSDDQPRTLEWALNHLSACPIDTSTLMDLSTEHSAENQRRIDWLFDNDAYDLALSERPDCHKDGTTYTWVYGRMRPNEPAPTITTGFTTPGRGRHVHPTERRTLTPREAATLQGFPLNYRFITEKGSLPTRTQLAKWIGNAVPMPLGYAAALSALGAVDIQS